MRTPTLVISLLAGVLVVLLASSCGGGGGDSLEEYYGRLQTINDDLYGAAESAAASAQASDAHTVEGLLDEIQGPLLDSRAALQDAVQQLEKIDPPSEAADAHERLVTAARTIVDGTGSIFDQITGIGSLRDISNLLANARDLDSAAADLHQACKDLQSIAGDNGIDVNLACAR